jgi:putative addiction module component (TIGR02574 family)
MTIAAQKQFAAKALALPRQARARLAHQLLESLDPPEEKISKKEWTRLWKIELEKRIEELESGKVKAIPAAQVMAELRAKYG